MKLLLACAGVALMTASVQAAPQIQQMLYNVDAAGQCAQAAQGVGELKDGLAACNIALADPQMLHRAALMTDRGIILVKLGETRAALADYNAAIALDDMLADAYVSRAGILVAMKRLDEARADIARAINLGATNLHAAYYTRGVIAEESGDARSAYRDYKQALALKPDYVPAQRELARFRTVPASAS